jgi:lariat debranching enzyme
MMKRILNVFVEGCCHSQLDEIYRQISLRNKPVDLVILCGDFQAVRNEQDLNCMSVPLKYRRLGDFHKYYTGEIKAPYLTVLIGGNHEASNHLWELYYGGWVAPNIYYLGAAGVVNFNGLRIGGISGIYNPAHYSLNHFERLPYNSSTERSAYHVRQFDSMKLSLIEQNIDVMLSHDWPCGIEKYGDMRYLLNKKKHLARDIHAGCLGSPPSMDLLRRLRPAYWFSGHLHVRFEAVVSHDVPSGSANDDEIDISSEIIANNDEIDITEELGDVESDDRAGESPKSKWSQTSFLALDKCLPNRRFLEHVQIEVDVAAHQPEDDQGLRYDPEWLAITRVMHKYFDTQPRRSELPQLKDQGTVKRSIVKELKWVQENVVDKGLLEIPRNFEVLTRSSSEIQEQESNKWAALQPPPIRNNQTDYFCQMVGIDNRITP